MSLQSGKSGNRGLCYEKLMCLYCSFCNYISEKKNFRLAYQVPEAGKFDDIIFDLGNGKFMLIQSKHKEDSSKKKITHAELFDDTYNTEYNLLKYVVSIKKANLNSIFNGKIQQALVLTNIDFELQGDMLRLDSPRIRKQKCQWEKWYNGADHIKLTPVDPLDVSIIGNFTNYHPTAKFYKFDDPNVVQILKRQAVTLAKDIAKDVRSISENEICDALQYIVYAVNQPNDKQLENIIKDQLKDHLKLQSVDIIYNSLVKKFEDWCNRTEPINPGKTSQPIVTYNDLEEFFQTNVKIISLGVTKPTTSFTGRIRELTKIKDGLSVNYEFKICGLGGVGKTELTKQYIQTFGNTDFYGRVIWIEADSFESVKSSFKRLAYALKIEDVPTKPIRTIIDEVFEYFEGFKSLFVFDNYDNYSDSDQENLVVYCREIVSTKKNRPHFLFTSRNRKCLLGIASLDLDVLTKDDGIQLIHNELSVVNPLQCEVENLAETLQYYPLALQQAIAYIKEQYEIKSMLDERYEVKDYLYEFEKEKHKLLNFKYHNEFGQYGKTTFITWNVTFDAIKSDKENGENAIKILQFLAYLYPDRINSKMFLPLFEHNVVRTGKALLLLDKYSLIKNIEKGNNFYKIHRLVQMVIQYKFKEAETETIQSAIKLVNPKLYQIYDQNDSFAENHMLDCSTDDFFHWNVLYDFVCSNPTSLEEFKFFFLILHNRALLYYGLNDDVEKVQALFVREQDFREMIDTFMKNNCNKIIKYVIHKFYLKEDAICPIYQNSRILNLCRGSLFHKNLNIFKYFVEKGCDLNKILEFSSVELIRETIQGNLDVVKNVINDNCTNLDNMLKETFFFATMFNQQSIVQFLLDKVDPNFYWERFTPLFVSAASGLKEIVELLLPKCDKSLLIETLFDLLNDNSFYDENIFKTIFLEYINVGGDINDKDDKNNTFLNFVCNYKRFSFKKLEIIRFLLENGADPISINNTNKMDPFYELNSALASFYYMKFEQDDLDNETQMLLDIIYKKMISNLSSEQIASIIGPTLFVSLYLRENSIFKKMVEDLFRQNINLTDIRDRWGRTLLIDYVRYDYDRSFSTCQSLVECNIDVNATDDEGNTALYESVCLEKSDIFKFLLTKIISVDEKTLINIIEYNKLTFMKILFEGNHIDIEYTFSNTKNLLEKAIQYYSTRSQDIFLYLLDKINNFDEKYLLKAIQENKWLVLKSFLDRNYVISNYVFNDGETLIKKSIDNFSCDIIFNLKDEFKTYHGQGGNTNIKNNEGQTLLINYLQKKFTKSNCITKWDEEQNEREVDILNNVKLLVDHGVDVNAKDNQGHTGLYYASLDKNDEDLFIYLLRKIKNIDKSTIILSLEWNSLSIIKVLFEEKQLNINQVFGDQKLIEIAIRHCYEKVPVFMYLLKKFENKIDEAILIKAIKRGKLSIIEALFDENHLNIDHVFSNGKTCLEILKTPPYDNRFVNEPPHDVLMYFLNKMNNVDESILLEAVKCNDLDIVKLLLSKKCFAATHQFSNGESIIKVAIENFSMDIIFHLKDQFKKYNREEGDLNVKNSRNRTLLDEYVSNIVQKQENMKREMKRFSKDENDKYLNNVKFLVENGVSLGTGKDSERIVLDAMKLKNVDIFEYLLSKIYSVTNYIIQKAIKTKDVRIVKAILYKTHFKIDEPLMPFKYSPLDIAITYKAFDIEQFMIQELEKIN